MENNSLVQSWITRAEDDIRWTEANIREEIWYGACFTAQQAAEKALKGYLIFRKEEVRKIHDISALLERCIRLTPTFETIRENTLPLVDYYLPTRYPDLSMFMEFSEEKATQALHDAKTIVAFVKEKISNI
jgi:HEPN domain-containing protein